MKINYAPFINYGKLRPVHVLNRVDLTSGMVIIENLELLRRELRLLLEQANIKVGMADSLSEAINGQMKRKDIIFIKHVSPDDLLKSCILESTNPSLYNSIKNDWGLNTIIINKNLQLIKKVPKPYECRIVIDEIIRNLKGGSST